MVSYIMLWRHYSMSFVLEKIPIRLFLCRQNHLARLIRHRTNNYCYFTRFVLGLAAL